MVKYFSSHEIILPIATYLKDEITVFKKKMPLIQSLTDQSLKERHWVKLSELLGYTISPMEGLSLYTLLEKGIEGQVEAIQDIVNVAKKEYSLEQVLDAMIKEWEKLSYDVTKLLNIRLLLTRRQEHVL